MGGKGSGQHGQQGRKPGKYGVRQTTSHRLSQEMIAYLRDRGDAGELLETVVRRTADFKRWAKDNATN